ncbi:MAG: circularly permuted type 2 ATP-grasp protein, partial [Oceanococcaceae bacterium]
LPLVDGEDLQVQGGRCWMLTPSGRQPIRALLRRMDDDYAEPLELNRQSILGTPCLLECVRGRSLSMANSLGAGVLENPA